MDENKYPELPIFKIEVREEFVDGVSQGKRYDFRMRELDSSYYSWKFTLKTEEEVVKLKEYMINFQNHA